MKRIALVLLMAALALAGCGSVADYYRLEEWGDGWKLDVRERGKQFEARWVEGSNRSMRLTNIDDRLNGVTAVNRFYLELDKDGKVVAGRMKRFITRDMNDPYKESLAQWFKVLSGTCVVDSSLNGQIDVQCEGDYAFKGIVRPAQKVEKIEHEKKRP